MKSKTNRIGERRLMNCGEYATIIRYGSILDIDVKFDSGEIVYNKVYNNFLKGGIAKSKSSRLNERRLMSCGEYATIIRYGSYRDIDVKFDSGEISKNKNYGRFLKGNIAKPIQGRIGERRLMNCGEYATIIRYRRYNDIDVKFDSGEVINNRRYSNFIRGRIAKKSKMILDANRLGERRLMDCGEYATIIRYGSSRDIDIKFDSGEKVKNKTYRNFRLGVISKPISRVGERRLMNCGEYATIIRYDNFKDIDVKFDSGEIVYNKNYGNFIKGMIACPKLSRIGERRLMNCGEYVTIIRYGNSQDVDVQFDSGIQVKNRSYAEFIRGAILKPVNRLGERRLMNCGLYATITGYYKAMSVDLQFEDDSIASNYSYTSFKRGCCRPDWYNARKMKKCYYDTVLNDTVILMKDERVVMKSELLGGNTDASEKR